MSGTSGSVSFGDIVGPDDDGNISFNVQVSSGPQPGIYALYLSPFTKPPTVSKDPTPVAGTKNVEFCVNVPAGATPGTYCFVRPCPGCSGL